MPQDQLMACSAVSKNRCLAFYPCFLFPMMIQKKNRAARAAHNTATLETEDTEILCITVCNPYSNVQLHGVKLFLIVVNADGTTLATQADGTPSVQIKPDCMIGFGDIPPCDPQGHESQDSCVSREVVMINCGAKEGKYKIKVFYCFNACFSINNMLDEPQLAFDVELVRS